MVVAAAVGAGRSADRGLGDIGECYETVLRDGVGCGTRSSRRGELVFV